MNYRQFNSNTKREANSTSKPIGKIARELPNRSEEKAQKIEKKRQNDAKKVLTNRLWSGNSNTITCGRRQEAQDVVVNQRGNHNG